MKKNYGRAMFDSRLSALSCTRRPKKVVFPVYLSIYLWKVFSRRVKSLECGPHYQPSTTRDIRTPHPARGAGEHAAPRSRSSPAGRCVHPRDARSTFARLRCRAVGRTMAPCVASATRAGRGPGDPSTQAPSGTREGRSRFGEVPGCTPAGPRPGARAAWPLRCAQCMRVEVGVCSKTPTEPPLEGPTRTPSREVASGRGVGGGTKTGGRGKGVEFWCEAPESSLGLGAR